jgi:ubiquinone/menaquinone biosynthesis C-methylase UbiE
MDHIDRTKQEFTRQAAGFSASAAITDRRSTQRIIEATGAGATSLALDVACGPGIVAVELAAVAREVVAFDLTPEMLIKARERCDTERNRSRGRALRAGGTWLTRSRLQGGEEGPV